MKSRMTDSSPSLLLPFSKREMYEVLPEFIRRSAASADISASPFRAASHTCYLYIAPKALLLSPLFLPLLRSLPHSCCPWHSFSSLSSFLEYIPF